MDALEPILRSAAARRRFRTPCPVYDVRMSSTSPSAIHVSMAQPGPMIFHRISNLVISTRFSSREDQGPARTFPGFRGDAVVRPASDRRTDTARYQGLGEA